MDVVDFFKAQVTKWNTETKCSFGWSYNAPLIESAVNATDFEECNDVFVMLYNLTINKSRSYSDLRLVSGISKTYSFDLLTVKKGEGLGQNNYHEQQEHPISESKHAETLKPLYDCLDVDRPFDFCDILGKDIEITNFSSTVVLNYMDANYDGWRHRITLTERL